MEHREQNWASILVVDDEAEMRAALCHVLNRIGYGVTGVSNGFEALEKIQTQDFSMVITDMKMPEMSGMQVLEEVKRVSFRTPVIMITAYGTINNAVEAMKAGASDYIIKPFSSEVLEVTVRKVFEAEKGRLNASDKNGFSRTETQDKKIITRDKAMLKVLDLAGNVAPSNSTILILGESGTGKEMLAAYIHQKSGRRDHAYVAVNCAALPENLAESELFGYEKGAFTGASHKKPGKFELAKNGTIVLDEISEMPISLQAKLLRALQEKKIDRIGGTRPVSIDARVIAISNVDLKKAVKEGRFREDLYYRINVIPFHVPPLRERKADIPLLTNYFLKKYCSLNRKKMMRIPEETLSLLLRREWKGNVRELENVIERAVLLGNGDLLRPDFLFGEETSVNPAQDLPLKAGISVKEMEKGLIFKTLEEVNNNRTHAARLLGISIRTLRNKLKEYSLEQQVQGNG